MVSYYYGFFQRAKVRTILDMAKHFTENFSKKIFLKKKAKIFGHVAEMSYLCNRKREIRL